MLHRNRAAQQRERVPEERRKETFVFGKVAWQQVLAMLRGRPAGATPRRTPGTRAR